jgi:hypothetical protein
MEERFAKKQKDRELLESNVELNTEGNGVTIDLNKTT